MQKQMSNFLICKTWKPILDKAGSANTYNYMYMRNAAIRIACRGADKRCQTSECITEPNSNRDQLVCSNETVIPLSTAQIIIKYDTEWIITFPI